MLVSFLSFSRVHLCSVYSLQFHVRCSVLRCFCSPPEVPVCAPYYPVLLSGSVSLLVLDLVLSLFLFSIYFYLFCPVTVNNLLSSDSHAPLRLFVVPVSPVFSWREDLGVGAAVVVATSLFYLDFLFFV